MLDGALHERDSSTLAFELAAFAAFREAADRAAAQVLEPVIAVEVTTPIDYLGDLHRRRGSVRGQQPGGKAAALEALVPLRKMFG